jgi:transcriptional regulator with XRE-family HTH domain
MNTSELAARVHDKRIDQRLTVRQAALAAGVARTTLFRVEHGERVRDYDSLVRIAGWLGVPLEELTTSQDEAREAPCPDNATTPETVARVLRADDSLGPEEVETLMVTFRALYARLQDQWSGRAHRDSEASTSSAR